MAEEESRGRWAEPFTLCFGSTREEPRLQAGLHHPTLYLLHMVDAGPGASGHHLHQLLPNPMHRGIIVRRVACGKPVLDELLVEGPALRLAVIVRAVAAGEKAQSVVERRQVVEVER